MIFSIKISCQSTDAIKPTKQWRHSILTLPRGQMWLLGSPSPGGARGLGGVGEKSREGEKKLTQNLSNQSQHVAQRVRSIGLYHLPLWHGA